MQTHESFDRKHESSTSSERSFGLVFAGVFALVAGYQAWHGAMPVAGWWLAGGAIFALLALFWTTPLVPLNRAWTLLGKFLHAIVSPLVMGLIFVVAIIPTGVMLRLFGKDLLRLRRDAAASTYWIHRDPAAIRADAMKDQF
jgi:hypothetical protein